jgi:multiple antibiotic resistance protein
MSFFALVISFFVVMNALGNIPLFVSVLGKYPIKTQRRIVTREMLIALLILLLFNFFGDDILRLLGISQPIIGIAGGTLLFIIALGMIFPSREKTPETNRHEPLIVPLATPMVAGPGAIATVMVYSDQVHNAFFMAGAIFVAWLACFIILFASSNIKYFLGKKGLAACEKLGGMIIILIAVQMFSSGIITLIQDTFYTKEVIEKAQND